MISREEVDKLAGLAKLDLSEEEHERFSGEIGHILDYIDQIKSAEITEVEKEDANLNLMREDVVTNTPGEFTAEIVREMPDSEDGSLKVHKILGDNE